MTAMPVPCHLETSNCIGADSLSVSITYTATDEEEKKNTTSGIFATGNMSAILPILYFARPGLRITPRFTVYTHGNIQLAEDPAAELSSTPQQIKVDAQKITRFVKVSNRAELIIHLDDGTQKTESFPAHKPQTKPKDSFAQ